VAERTGVAISMPSAVFEKHQYAIHLNIRLWSGLNAAKNAKSQLIIFREVFEKPVSNFCGC